LKLLKKRGDAIKNEKYEKMREINDEIDKMCEDEKIRDKWQTPCTCFITFLDEEGAGRAKNFQESVWGKNAQFKNF